MSQHASPLQPPTEPSNGSQQAPQPDAQQKTPLPRRRDIHRPTSSDRPDAAERRRASGRRPAPSGRRRAGVPIALTVMALSTGLASGVAATADGATTTSPSSSAAGAHSATSGRSGTAVSTAAVDAPVAEAQAALERAQVVTADAVSLSASQRKKIAGQTEALRDLVAADTGSGTAAGAASRTADREPLRARQAATDKKADTKADDTKADDTKADDTKADDTKQSSADQALVPSMAVGDVYGADALNGGADVASTDTASSGAAAADEPAEDDLTAATAKLTKLLDTSETSQVDIEPAPATPAEILDDEAKKARAATAALAKHANDTAGYENGRVPTNDLCELSFAPGESLRCDAAKQLERLDVAFHAKFGKHLEINDSYRSYDSQVAVKASRGHFAAVPGYSDHGWGIAVDVNGGVESFGTAQYEWLRHNAPEFGWDNPGWARSDGRKPEAWHWEYSPLS